MHALRTVSIDKILRFINTLIIVIIIITTGIYTDLFGVLIGHVKDRQVRVVLDELVHLQQVRYVAVFS